MGGGDWTAGAMPAARAARRRRLTRALGVALLLLVGGAIAWGRCAAAGEREAAAEARGAAALLRATRGDAAAWADARAAWRDVARADVLGGYGAMVLALVDHLERGALPEAPPATRAVLAAVAAGDPAAARAALEALEDPLARRWLARLVAALTAAEAAPNGPR